MTSKEQPALRHAVPTARLVAQRIVCPGARTARQVVQWLGAVQAQDYAGSKWALALRLGSAEVGEIAVEQALADGEILRTHLMRWTWQLVLPEDVRWMLDLVRDRLIVRAARRHRQLELDETTFRKSDAVLDRALRDGEHLTRDELATRLEQSGISPRGERLSHLLGHAELDAVICSGARRGKQLTYTHLDRRASGQRAPRLRDEALAELARRYYQSRGPAALADFAWWSGLTMSEARAGTDALGSSLVREVIEGQTYFSVSASATGTKLTARTAPSSQCQLLPAFDEYLVAYRNRDAVLDPRKAQRLNAGGGILAPTILLDGRVIGTWRRQIMREGIAVEIDLFEKTSRTALDAITSAARRLGRFLGGRTEIGRVMVAGHDATSRLRASPGSTARSAGRPMRERLEGPSKNRVRASRPGVKKSDAKLGKANAMAKTSKKKTKPAAKTARAGSQTKKPAARAKAAKRPSSTKRATAKPAARTVAARRADFGAPIDGFFAKQPPNLRVILETLRLLVEEIAPDATASLKWGMPFYSIGSSMMCALAGHKAHVNLILSGPPNAFADPEGVLTGEGKTGRHLMLRHIDDLPRAAVRRWVRTAYDLARAKA